MARSDIPAERLRYAPGQFLTLRVPSDRTGSVARCYSLCSSPFTDEAMTVTVKRDKDGYASNWLCDHAHRRHADSRAGAVGHIRAQNPRRRLPAAVRRQRNHADLVDLQVGAVRRRRAGGVGLRQPRRAVGDLRRRAAGTHGKVSRPADRRALAGVAAGVAVGYRARSTGCPVHRPAGVHLRAGALHGSRSRGARNPESACTASTSRGIQVAGQRPVRRGENRARRR